MSLQQNIRTAICLAANCPTANYPVANSLTANCQAMGGKVAAYVIEEEEV